MSAPVPTPPRDSQLVSAMLAVEHGLLYGVQQALGFAVASGAVPATTELLQISIDAHRSLRDKLAETLDHWAVTPPAAADAYSLPATDRDTAGACRLAAAMEDRGGASWLEAVGRTSDRGLRAMCGDALTAAAVRAARYRTVLGSPPDQAAPSFPGR